MYNEGNMSKGLTKRQKEILELLKVEGKQSLIEFEEKEVCECD